MMVTASELERLRNAHRDGQITAAEFNVGKVLMERVHLVTKLIAPVRRDLNAAVKAGTLGHKVKRGILPEVYYHPAFEYLVAGTRNAHARMVARAVSGVCE
jgi:hypothetical protein